MRTRAWRRGHVRPCATLTQNGKKMCSTGTPLVKNAFWKTGTYLTEQYCISQEQIPNARPELTRRRSPRPKRPTSLAGSICWHWMPS
jgi:hypothetical protein